MMMDFQLLSVIIGIFIGIGTLIAGCGFAYAQFQTGGAKLKDDVIKTLQTALEVEKEEKAKLIQEKNELINSHQIQLNQLNKDFAELKGRFDEQAKRTSEYKELLQGRDPESQKFMQVVMKQIEEGQKTTPQVQAYMKETTQILKEIRDYIHSTNEERKDKK